MNTASKNGGSRWSKLLLFSFALLFTVPAARAQTADVCAAAIESGATVVTNTAQFASLFDEWAVNYPLVHPYEPAVFEGMDEWWVDLNQLTNALAAVRSYPGRQSYGVTEWPLRLIRAADTGQIVVKYPGSDLELLHVEAPANYVPLQQYDRVLPLYCILGLVMNPTNYDALIDQGYTFLDPPRTVLDVWLADLNDWPTYQSNVVAEAAAQSATALQEAEVASSMGMAEDSSGGGMMMMLGGDPCTLTNETDGFSILSITADTNQWITIMWESCTNFLYETQTSEELSTQTIWTVRATMVGEVGTTSWTDENAPSFDDRFYRVGRLVFDGDADGDGLSNIDEFNLGTDLHNPDTDGDGLPDGVDADPLNFDHSVPSFTVAYPQNGETIYP